MVLLLQRYTIAEASGRRGEGEEALVARLVAKVIRIFFALHLVFLRGGETTDS
jgi:hypothetical protein